jgi:fermentation-respiration switch protein FrsA (DUF1100 family)
LVETRGGNILPVLNAYPFVKFLVFLAVVSLCAIGLIWLFQRKMIYLPMVQSVPPAGQVLTGASDVSFETTDGLVLRGWFVPAAGDGEGRAVLVFNGNAGNRSLRAPLAAALSMEGFSVLLFDYRGYGGNPGSPSEKGLRKDARAARAYLEGREEVDPEKVAFFGESLGAAVALEAAVERPPAALVLRSPFTSLTDIGRRHYPFLPVRLLLSDRYPSIDQIGRLACPLLVIAGERDWIVPISYSRELYEAAPDGEKRFIALPGVGHNDFEMLAGRRLVSETAVFIREATTRPEGP